MVLMARRPWDGDDGGSGPITTYDLIGGVALPECPTDYDGALPYPTVVSTYILLGALCIAFATATWVKYNSVQVFNLRIRTAEISNNLWICFFIAIACQSVLDAVRYAMDYVSDDESLENMGLLLGSLVLDGVAMLCLSLALNHQRKYRSTAPRSNSVSNMATAGIGGKASDPLLRHAGTYSSTAESAPGRTPISETLKMIFFSLDTLFFVVFFLYMMTLLFQVSTSTSEVTYWLFISGCVLLRLPPLTLTLVIISRHSVSDGPTAASKRLLFFGTLLNTVMILPPSIWAYYIGGDCVLVIGSVVDLMQWVYVGSMVLYFVFLRAEYMRNMEECIWTTVSRIQDTFNYRRF